jgi:hypothetical protein
VKIDIGSIKCKSQLDKSLKGVDKKMGVTYKILEPGARKAGATNFGILGSG